ncbi:GNAT family N-acetyltransferase [Sorangium sp. So ce134]
MNVTLQIIEVNDAAGEVIAPDWLAKAEPVHRQLRPRLPEEYAGTMRRVFAGGGRMCVAADGDAVIGVAVYRVYENTYDGVQMYVDDLVTCQSVRSKGVGKAMMDHLQERARQQGCASYNLDSGVQRSQAHKFYFREGMVVVGFHFGKLLKQS